MKFTAFAMVVAALLGVPAMGQDAQSISQAQAAATTWLALVDAGKYSASWEQAAGPFKAAVPEPSWEAAATRARAPLGAFKSRQILSSTFTHTLPGAPDGDYVVIKYSSQFENKGSAVETVTPLREKDGTWRVSGYYVK
ncbi:MAG: DUF4019 domain-containing protein [Steroidobacteraceae bacterium]|jgi:hypothetical protein